MRNTVNIERNRESGYSLLKNAHVTCEIAFDTCGWRALSGRECDRAKIDISSWPGYAVTPLYRLRTWAQRLDVAEVWYKDESSRFGLGSFKPLGAGYAVWKLVEDLRGYTRHTVDRLCGTASKYGAAKRLTLATATDGNHGRAVAWAAEKFGCDCVVYVPQQCSTARRAAIENHGATVRHTELDYDHTVRLCERDSGINGWIVVSDTSWPGYELVPVIVMAGYTVMTAEIIEELERESLIPTHVFVQAGVGGLAAAVCAHFWSYWGQRRPQLVVVEPEGAACLFASALAGGVTAAPEPVQTVMAGLCCGLPSPLAWRLLSIGADFFMTIPDNVVPQTMKHLAMPNPGDPPIVAGESAVAGLAALTCVALDRGDRHTLGLTPKSRVLLIGTEGDTDATIYEKLVGVSGNVVREAAQKWKRQHGSP